MVISRLLQLTSASALTMWGKLSLSALGICVGKMALVVRHDLAPSYQLVLKPKSCGSGTWIPVWRLWFGTLVGE